MAAPISYEGGYSQYYLILYSLNIFAIFFCSDNKLTLAITREHNSAAVEGIEIDSHRQAQVTVFSPFFHFPFMRNEYLLGKIKDFKLIDVPIILFRCDRCGKSSEAATSRGLRLQSSSSPN